MQLQKEKEHIPLKVAELPQVTLVLFNTPQIEIDFLEIYKMTSTYN